MPAQAQTRNATDSALTSVRGIANLPKWILSQVTARAEVDEFFSAIHYPAQSSAVPSSH